MSKCRACGAPTKCEEELQQAQARIGELEELLGKVHDLIETGDPCYLDPENMDDYIGNAVRLDDDLDDRIVKAINREGGSDG